jgi:hypothetical protein
VEVLVSAPTSPASASLIAGANPPSPAPRSTLYIVLLVFYLVMVYLRFVETKGYTSEETSAMFDGHVDDVIAHAAEGLDEKAEAKASKGSFVEHA